MPAAGAQQLSAIGNTARAALTEMRRLLGVLRADTRDEPVRRQPQPGLDQLTQLLDDARDATGAGTRLIISGWVTALDPGIELAAFRIIQEALTNALKVVGDAYYARIYRSAAVRLGLADWQQLRPRLARHASHDAAQRAEIAAESERLGKTLLDSISHEMRTPISAITSRSRRKWAPASTRSMKNMAPCRISC